MIFFFGTGTISPRDRVRNGEQITFLLQGPGQTFKVTTAGLVQTEIINGIKNGEAVYIMGYPVAEGKRVTIKPRIILPAQTADPDAMGRLFNQIVEAHIESKK